MPVGEQHEDAADPDDQEGQVSQTPLLNRVVTVEHPCIIRNLQNGFNSLGGEPQLKRMLEHRVGDSQVKVNGKTNVLPEPMIGVSLRPNDPFAKRMPSVGIRTRNVLVRVTVPRWTGRKRKRGSNEPFVAVSSPPYSGNDVSAPLLLRRLQDNQHDYRTQPIETVSETFRFRNLPDLQLQNAELPIMREIRDNALSPTYDRLANFKVDLTPGPSRVEEFPGPPHFLGVEQPYSYGHQQAPGVVYQVKADGSHASVNLAAPRRRGVEAVPCDIEIVPQGPPANLKQHTRASDTVSKAIEAVTNLLKTRPLVTNRVLGLEMREYSDFVLKDATQWTCYRFKSGPYRDLHIKYGVDPRSDPQFRKYQTLTFQLESDTTARSIDPASSSTESSKDLLGYMFDGVHLSPNCKTWQICDITDEVLKFLFETSEVRSECDVQVCGWYSSLAICKARVIMRDKIRRLQQGEVLPAPIYLPLLTYLDGVDIKHLTQTPLPDKSSFDKVTMQLAMDIRQIVRAMPEYKKDDDVSAEPNLIEDEVERQGMEDDESEPDDKASNQDDVGAASGAESN